jgi:hypothetical protein
MESELAGKPKYSEKTCPSATLSTTNPKRHKLGSNPGSRGGKPATNHPSNGAAIVLLLCSQYHKAIQYLFQSRILIENIIELS